MHWSLVTTDWPVTRASRPEASGHTLVTSLRHNIDTGQQNTAITLTARTLQNTHDKSKQF